MSILKYQIADEANGIVSVYIDKKAEKVIVETELNLIECSFQDWQKLTSNIAKDIEAYQESKPKRFWGKYYLVKK